MSSFAVHTTINTPIKQVWEALANIGTIHEWNPGVINSYVTSDGGPSGINATRHCDLGGNNYLDEAVVHYVPEKAITMRITKTNLPFKAADIRFTLEALGSASTQVTCSPLYELKFGPIGKLLDRFYVSSSYQSGMQSLLAGLKEHLENPKRSINV